jgi:hypothetical protein
MQHGISRWFTQCCVNFFGAELSDTVCDWGTDRASFQATNAIVLMLSLLMVINARQSAEIG